MTLLLSRLNPHSPINYRRLGTLQTWGVHAGVRRGRRAQIPCPDRACCPVLADGPDDRPAER